MNSQTDLKLTLSQNEPLTTNYMIYSCRQRSTNQPFILQNKANLRKAKMNKNLFAAKDYDNKTTFRLKKNKPNSNPISNFSASLALKSFLYWSYVSCGFRFTSACRVNRIKAQLTCTSSKNGKNTTI